MVFNNSGYNYFKFYKKGILLFSLNIKSIATLFIKAFVILVLFNLADVLYHKYNSNYHTIKAFTFNLWFYLNIVAILLFKSLYIRIAFLSILLMSILFEFLHYQYFGTYIQPISFYQFANNTSEVFLSFFDEIKNMIIPFIIVLAITISISVLNITKKTNSYRNTLLGSLLLIVSFIYGGVYTYKNLHSESGKLWHKQAKRVLPMPKHHSAVNFIRSLNYFLVGIVPKKILSNSSEKFPILKEPKLKEKNINANIIFIIGESLRAKELHILGYDLNTTPNLIKIDGLFATSIFSAGTMTKSSVSAILNRVKYPGVTSQMVQMKNNLFYLAKKNGFNTYFYSQQSNSQLDILQNYLGMRYIDDYASREMLKKKLKHAKGYDIKLLQALQTIELDNNNFVVLHMRGSHSPYDQQYPKKFDKFKNPYDNTVLYTDYFLSEVIKYLKENSKKPTYIVFTSDHGELLHEYGRNGHGWFFKEVYRVPFIFYAINSDKNLPLDKIQSHFHVSTLVAQLLGYDVNIEREDTIYVNGSDIDALAGYLKIKVDKENNELKVQEIR
jgi:glucan phosphoethanolaminetransferase (alkaline phosphatase superfamily)